MIVLALDTAGDRCTVGLRVHGRLVAGDSRPARRGHAEILMPQVAAAFGLAGLSPTAVDVFGATVGPGSFTGIRVGLAALAGLALGAGRPMLGVTRFAAHAAAVPPDAAAERLWVCLDNRRGGLFVQPFDRDAGRWRPAAPPDIRTPAAMRAALARSPGVVVGDAVAGLDLPANDPAVIGPAPPGPDHLTILVEARAAEARAQCPVPLYLGGAAVAVPA